MTPGVDPDSRPKREIVTEHERAGGHRTRKPGCDQPRLPLGTGVPRVPTTPEPKAEPDRDQEGNREHQPSIWRIVKGPGIAFPPGQREPHEPQSTTTRQA